MFFIDGAHGKGDVVRDIKNLKKFQSENCIWVFDDYNRRFGIFEELKIIENKYKKTFVIEQTHKNAEKSNKMLIVYGRM
jgi:hypothetical protein